MKKLLLLIIIGMFTGVMCVGTSYATISEKQAFDDASRLDTIEAYHDFLKQYPVGKNRDKAIEQLSKKYLKKGAEFLVKEDLDAAFGQFEQIILIDINNVSGLVPEAYNNLGLIRLKQSDGLSKESIEYYQKSIKVAPGFYTAYLNLASVYINYGIEEKNIAPFKQAMIALDSAKKLSRQMTAEDEAYLRQEIVRAHDNLAMLYVEQDDSQNAIKEFNEMLAIEPKNLRAHMNLGFEYTKNREYEKASYQMKKAIEYAEAEGRKDVSERLRYFYENVLPKYIQNPHLDPRE